MATKKSPDPAPINPVLAIFDDLPDDAEVRLPVVEGLHGISGPTVWRWSKSGLLPAPTKRGNVTTWNVGRLRRHKTPTAA